MQFVLDRLPRRGNDHRGNIGVILHGVDPSVGFELVKRDGLAGRLRWPPTDIKITGSSIVLSTTSAHFRKKLMDNVTLIRDVSHPIPLENASPRRLTGILQDAGFTFDAVKGRLGTEYRQWSPKGAGVAGKFRAFFECAGMRADIGARMFGPAGSGILDTIAGFFKKRGPKDQRDLLIWLFLFNEPVKVTALSCIFSPDDLNALAAMNLIRLDAGAAICDLALYECAGLFLATDAIVKVNHPAVANPVMALLAESYDFVGSVSRKPVNAALDLCTGSGVHALVAARHAKHVVATDINPRALRFAEFNAWFNGITNIEFCRGD